MFIVAFLTLMLFQPEHQAEIMATGLLSILVGDSGLLLHGGGNLLVLVDDHSYGAEDIFQGLLDLFRLTHGAIGHFMATAHGLDCRCHAAVQAADHLFDFFCGVLGAPGQGAHLIGHHRKPRR